MSDWQRTLDDALKRLGLSPTNHQFSKGMPKFSARGNIVLQSAEDWKNIKIDQKTGALLNPQKQTIVVYIQDHTFLSYQQNLNTSSDLESTLKDYEMLNKVHLTWCTTLKSMKRQGRYERYIGTQSPENKYPIDVPSYKEKPEVKLRPCINCLKIVDKKAGIQPRQHNKEYFDKFDIRKWFEYCDKHNVTPPRQPR